MNQAKQQRLYIRLIVVFCLFLLAILAGFQSIWVASGSASSILLQTGLQRTRAQAIAKDVLILSSRPSSEHTQAINELQDVLPRFEQTQAGLQSGDPSLGLPPHVPSDIVLLLTNSQSDFIAIDTATTKLLAHTNGQVDQTQVNIIVMHEHSYTTEISAVVNAWQSRIDTAFFDIFLWEIGLVGALMLTLIGKYVFLTRHIMNKLVEDAQEREAKQS